jgi:CHAT domain-containing protein
VHKVRKARAELGVLVLLLLLGAGAISAAQDTAALIKTADAHLAAYRYPQALELYERIPDTAPPEQRLDKHAGIAMSLMGMGRFTDVGTHVTGAMTIAQQVGSDAALARAESLAGLYQSDLRTGDYGLAAFGRAADYASRAGATKALVSIYANLSRTYQSLEDYERSAYFSQKAYELEANPAPGRAFNYHMGRGIAFFEMYDRNAAESEFRKGLALSAQTGRPRDRSFAIGELAYTYWTFDRDAARALPLYDEAIALAREAKVAASEANWLANRGNIFRDTGDYDRALADYRAAIAILDAGGQSRNTFFMWKNIGQTMRLRGETKAAAALLDKLIRERASDASPRHQWQAHMELASAHATLGDRDRARWHFDKMIETLEEQRKTRILDTFRTGSFAHALSAYDPYDRYIRFLLEDGQAFDALSVAERARARGFLEALASVRGAVAANVPASLLADEAQISKAISSAQERLRSPALDKGARQSALDALAQAEQARDKFLLKMRVEHPALAEARYPTLLTAAETQRTLRPGETAFVFFLAEPASIRWTITRDTIRAASLAGRAEIERRASRVRELLSAPSDLSTMRDAAARLAELLFSGAALAGSKPLVIVPHGVLHYIPFEALPVGGQLLVERHAISYAPSLNALAHLRSTPSSDASFRVLAVGNPTVSAGAGAALRGGDVENLALLGPLPFAEQELYSIGRAFPDRTRVMSGASARESDLRSPELSRFPVIHFATHGLVSDSQPKRSGLLLAPEAGEDGLLQMSEIYGLNLRANLIVLSACQTALGKEITGEGLVGLSRAFFYAGARSVVAALWNLNDRFAAEFIERFYTELNGGVAAEEALRRVKASYVGHPRYAHPFYWSSLVILGDGTRPLVAERVVGSLVPPVLGVLLALSAVAIVAAKGRQK